MFTDNCDTGAQLRKAISHFFGRNKSCTLKIPPHVWVHYCRKHYQRIRYRNSKDYGLIQIDLVRMQVEMLQDWSQKNQEGGQGRYIKDWALALRKREQQRLEELGPRAAEGPSSTPQWVFDSLGSGYMSEQILGMVDRFRSELLDKTLEDIPEIEFLPDIVGGDDEGKNKNTKPRKQNKRKASQPSLQQQLTRPEGTEAADPSLRNDSATGPGKGKRARFDHPNPCLLHGRSSEFADHTTLPPRLYAAPVHETGFGEHSGLEIQTHHPPSPYRGQGYATSDPTLNTTGDRVPGRSINHSPTQALQNAPMRTRDHTQHYAGSFLNEIRNETFAKLPSLSERGPIDDANTNRYLPPISTPYDPPDVAGRMALNGRTYPNGQPRYSDRLPHCEHQGSNSGRPSAARTLGTTVQQWSNVSGADSESPLDSNSTGNRSFPQPPRLAYQPALLSSQVPWVRRYGLEDHPGLGNGAAQAGQAYMSALPSGVPHSSGSGPFQQPYGRLPGESNSFPYPVSSSGHVGSPVHVSSNMMSGGAGLESSASGGRYISSFAFRQPVDRTYDQEDVNYGLGGNGPTVCGSGFGYESRHPQKGHSGNGSEESGNRSSPASHPPVPSPFIATGSPVARMRSGSSGSQGSTPRADEHQ